MKNFKTSNKYVCMYAYYEKNDMYKQNLNYFLKNGILDEIDYYIIINGSYTLEIPIKDNIIIIKRLNEGYDFGAWSHCVKKYLTKNYDYYIFINSSVIGPYYSKSHHENWLKEFLKLFNTNDVKLVGTSINIFTEPYENKSQFIIETKNILKYDEPYTHIQSMFFILNSDGFNFILNKGFFDNEDIIKKLSFNDVIINYEIRLSQLILKNNWNINCILEKYKNYDYRIIKENFNININNVTDPYYINGYFNETIKPEDVIFFKNNRFNANIDGNNQSDVSHIIDYFSETKKPEGTNLKNSICYSYIYINEIYLYFLILTIFIIIIYYFYINIQLCNKKI